MPSPDWTVATAGSPGSISGGQFKNLTDLYFAQASSNNHSLDICSMGSSMGSSTITSKLSDHLQPGQTVQITKRGKPHGLYTKIPAQRIKRPDFLANLKKLGCSEAVGESLFKKFYDSIL